MLSMVLKTGPDWLDRRPIIVLGQSGQLDWKCIESGLDRLNRMNRSVLSEPAGLIKLFIYFK